MATEPKCPSCGVEGVEYVISTESTQKASNGQPWFEIAHCSGCGHIYGVFPKIVHGPQIKPF